MSIDNADVSVGSAIPATSDAHVPSADVSAPLVVQPWRRYGHERAYVKRGGEDLGFRDLKTGEITCARPELTSLVALATAELYDRAKMMAAARSYVPKHGSVEEPPAAKSKAPERRAPRAEPPLRPDEDLAFNLPGQSVRKVATELRDAAPVRTFLSRVVGAKTDERAYRIGADGEVEVARRLAKLGPDWKILHSVPIGTGDSDIDHVVIGPAGVFTINTKNHPDANVWIGGDTLKVNGHNQPYVRNSRHEATRAAKLLSAVAGFDVDVIGIIAIMGARGGFTVKEQPRDGSVRVVTRKEMASHLRGLPAVLGEPSIARIYSVARHLATWQPTTVRWSDLPLP